MTNEQKQILAYKRDGFGYKKIGQLMGLCKNTIKAYKRNKSENQIDVQNGICPAVVNQYKYPLAESRESSAPTNAG